MDKALNGDPYLAKIKNIVMGKINKDSKFDYVRSALHEAIQQIVLGEDEPIEKSINDIIRESLVYRFLMNNGYPKTALMMHIEAKIRYPNEDELRDMGLQPDFIRKKINEIPANDRWKIRKLAPTTENHEPSILEKLGKAEDSRKMVEKELDAHRKDQFKKRVESASRRREQLEQFSDQTNSSRSSYYDNEPDKQDMDIDEPSDSERYSWLPAKDNLKTDHVEVEKSPLQAKFVIKFYVIYDIKIPNDHVK
ncbi:hypothetical protein WR25_03692 [Diploscapter pachys]|uniref:LisH domain-containing protein n=1 Tax=Diploscapter pachys TaxID=2018661 RepID=A0A2A2LPE2_9BILA|nr:hypothetical protein WR25_03692 [Diploscapter pachys]